MEVPNFKKSRLSQLISHGLIISGRGGSKGGGGARTPVEANDTVNSRAMASVLDLLGEGVVGGLVDGAKSIFLNDTPLQNDDGSYNFSGVTWWFRDGSQDQSVIDGFDFIETPKSVNMQLKQTNQVNVALDSADSDRVRVVMKFPSLRNVNKENGDTNGTTVQYKFQIDAGNGKGFVDMIAEGEKTSLITLTAKKTGVYYRSYVIDLPKPAKAYTLRAIRLTEDHKDSSYVYDDTYVDSIGEIVNTSLNYPNSVLAGLKINSEQFGSSMPSRSYLIKGMKIRVPSNYNANTNTYDGNWDGTFQLASSSNPAWILFDLLTNARYGLGEFVKESMVNIGELYQIGRYCDAFVDDGFGGKEKRFSINTQITSRQDAYRVVQDIAGAFRGMIYWAGGMVHITQDSPADPVMLFSNSNVVNGSFAYKGSSRKDRYSVALVTYNNKEDGYKQSVEYVEDQEAIKRYGVRKTESVAFGCTSRGQAHRVGLWTLYTSRMESDVITFSVGMDSVFLMPGDVVLIADKFRAGRRNSGRITGFTSNSIKLDAPVDLTAVGNHITFMSSEGKMVERDILENGKNVSTVTFKNALSINDTPVADAVWVIAQPDLAPLQARVTSVAEGTDGTSFNITAIQNNPTKYEAIDSGAQLIPQNTTVLDPTFSKPSGLTVTEGTYLASPGNLSISLTAAWEGKSAQYYVSWRRSDAGNVSNWKSQRVIEEQFEIRDIAENGQYDFQVYAVSVSGRKTDTISTTYKVLGTMSAPEAPTGLTAVGDYRAVVLNWVNPSSVDLDHIEVLASKINDKAKAQLIAKVSGTTFSHNGLEDSVTWYYWVRAVNKRGMMSPLNSPLATTATTRDVLSFLKNKITESELGSGLLSDLDSKAVSTEVDAAIKEASDNAQASIDSVRKESADALSAAEDAINASVKSAQDSINSSLNAAQKTLNDAISKEASDRATAVNNEASARGKAIAGETAARNKAISDEAAARSKAVSDEATARNKAVVDEATSRASAINDSLAVEANNRSKAVSDAVTSLSSKIEQEAKNRSAAVTALDTKTADAISSETAGRVAAVESEARARADGLLQEKNSRQSEISTLKTQVQTSTDSLAQQISQVAAGTGEQFDSLNIWYFDTSNEGWTEDDNGNTPMSVTSDGWLQSANGTASYRSPNNMAIDAAAYRFVKLRLKKVGSPVWAGKLFWIGASEGGWSDARALTINEPEYDANGVATLTIHDIDWRTSETIRRFRFDFLKNQDSKNYVQIDWIAVGRPTPGAGMAALQDEKNARVNADAAEAANRNTLAVQMRGSYEGNDLSKVGSGLIYQEQQARVTADKAEATSRQALETKVNDSVSSVNKSLDTLNEQDQAMASDITGIKSSLSGKADASALQTLQTKVTQQGSSVSTQGQSITKLQNDLNTANTNIGKKADQTAVTALQGTVTQQGKDIASANSSITSLKSSIDATNTNVAKKADASTVSNLSSRVSSTEDKVSSQGDSITQLNNSLQSASADADAAKSTPGNILKNNSFERGFDGWDNTGWVTLAAQLPKSGSYILQASKVPTGDLACNQLITLQGGKTYRFGAWVRKSNDLASANPSNTKISIRNDNGPIQDLFIVVSSLSTNWSMVSAEYKPNSDVTLTISLRASLSAGYLYLDDVFVIDVTNEKAIDAQASAMSSLQNTVTQQGKDLVSQGTSITGLQNSIKTTNDAVSKKADSSAVSSLQSTVTQQGKDISSASSDIATLKNNLNTTNANVAKKADATALSSLQSTVTSQGNTVTSQGTRIDSLNNSLTSLTKNVSNKADASAVQTLQNTVTEQGKTLKSNTESIDAFNNSLSLLGDMGSNIVPNFDFRNGLNLWAQQIPDNIVWGETSGDGAPGVVMNNTGAGNPGLFSNNSSWFPVSGKRRFRFVVRAKALSGTGNILVRVFTDRANAGAYTQDTVIFGGSFETKTVDLPFTAESVTAIRVAIYAFPNVGSVAVDSVSVFDVTDATAINTNASAISTLQSTVTQQGKDISSGSSSITSLKNSLDTTNANVAKKADATALSSLQSTVTQQGKDIATVSTAATSLKNSLSNTDANVAKKADSSTVSTLQNTVTQQGKDIATANSSITNLQSGLNTANSNIGKKADATALNTLTSRVSDNEKKTSSQADSITSLNNSLSQQSKRGANILPDGTFESYAVGDNLAGGRVIVTSDDSHSGSKCVRVTRSNNYNPTSTDNNDNNIFSGFAVRDNGTYYIEYWAKLDPNGQKPADGTSINIGMSIQYQDGSWQWPSVGVAAKNLTTTEWTKVSGVLKLSKSGVKQSIIRITVPNATTVKAGDTFLVDNLVISEITDAYNAQQTADANASAIQSLNSSVEKNGANIASQATAITKLSNDLSTANGNISKKADASAVQTLQNTVTEQGKNLTSQSDRITGLQNNLNTTNGNVSKKAEQSALDSLTGRVAKTESGITATNSNVTTLTAAIRAGNASSGDLISNPTFDPAFSQMGFNVVSSTSDGVPAGCPFGYVAKIAARDHHPNFAAIPATLDDVIEITAMVACGAGAANFNLYIGTATSPNGGVGQPLAAGGGTKASATWQKTTWRFKVTQTMVNRGYIRPFLQIEQSSPFGTIWYVTDWHMRNITAAASAQDTADATSKAVDSLTSTVTQQGKDISSVSSRTTTLENGLKTTNANVSTKADASALSSLQNTVTQHGKDLTSQASNITSLQNSLGTTNTNVSKKADSSALSSLENTVNQQGDSIGSQGSQITMLSNSITEGSLIGNGGLSVDAAMWADSGPGSGYEYNSTDKAIRTTTASIRIANIKRIPVEPGTALTLTFDFKMSENVTAYSADTIGFIASLDDATNWLVSQSSWLKDVSTTWQTKTITLTIPDNYSGNYVYLRFAAGSWAPATTARLSLRKVDVTASNGVAKKADASAVNTLSSRVDSVQGSVTSQGSQITNLQNNLSTTNSNVSKKADATALSALQNTVTQQGKDISASNSSITNLQASINRRTVFTVTSRGTGSSAKEGIFDESGDKLFSPSRSYSMVTFKVNSDNSTSINTSKVYDVFGGAANGKTMSDDIAALTNGTYVCVLTSDEPIGNRASISAAMELLGGTTEVLNSLPYRGAYILLGRKGMKAGDGLELRAPTGGAADSYISTSVEFVNGIMAGLGAAGGVMMKADANASAISTLQNSVTQQGKDITSASSQITALQNSLSTTNSNVSKKADSTALSALQSTVTSQGNTLTSQGNRVTSLENNLTLGDNIIPNSAMLNNAQGWNGSATTVDGYPAVTSSAAWAPTSPKFAVTPGDTIDFSLLCLAGAAINNLSWGIRFDGPSLTNNTVYVGASNYAAGEKKNVTGTITVPAGATTGHIQPSTGGTIALTLYNVDVTRRNAGTVANGKAITDLTNKVTQQGKDISSASSSITNLQNSLNTTNTNVNKKADATALSALQNTVNQHGTTLTSQGNSLTSLSNDLSNLQIGGTNLLRNSALDKNLDSWRTNASPTVSFVADSTIPNKRTECLQMVTTGAGKGIYQASGFAGVKGDTFTISFWAKAKTAGSTLSVMTENVSGKIVSLTAAWAYYTVTGTKANANNWSLILYSNVADTYWLSNVKLERGDKATDWSPSPLDVDSALDSQSKAISTLDSAVSQHGKDISSAASSITNLQNGLSAANGNISKKADATALSSLQNTVTQQGKDISSQGASLTQLTNSLNATNDSIDASGVIPGNMITNASFERDNGGYTTWSGPVSVMTAVSPHSGSKILKIASGGPALAGQKITYVKGRTYKIGMWARQEWNTTINGGTSNTKFRVADSTGLIASFGYGPFTASWQEISWTWTATKDMVADTQITASLNAGFMYFDDFYVIDITDRVDLDATSSALSSLTSRVTNAEGKVTTNSASITTLNNTVSSLNKTVAAKADTSALQSLQNTVTQHGKDLTAASGNITSLQSSLSQVRKSGANLVIDGSFETLNPTGNLSIFTGDKHSGSRCARFKRSAATGSGGNNDVNYGEWFDLRANQVVYVEIWAKLDAANTVSAPGGYANVGMQWQDSAQKNNWPSAFQIKFDNLTTSWQKFSGYVRAGADAFRGIMWMSIPQNTTNIQGYSFLIDDVIIMDATEGYNAQQTANAASTAVSDLSTKVTAIDGKVTAQTNQLASMQSKVDGASSKVDQLSKTISDNQSTQASLNTSLQSQISSQASANIKNQADLNSTMTSIASIKSTQSTQATQLSAVAKSQTDMTATLSNQTASIQTLQKAVSNNDSLNSTWMVKMETNSAGKKYAAGIALGIDGKNLQSQFLVQADRFALINTSNGNTTTPFVIENGVTYMNAAYIKDGSIGSAKVGDLMSNGFQENVKGWRISRDGTMNINGSGAGGARTTITNGKIEVYDSNNRLRVRMGIF